MSIAVAGNLLAERFIINDFNTPLASLWREIIDYPERLASRYAAIWHKQEHGKEVDFYKQIRTEFNFRPRTEYFLFLLARCAKAAVRYNKKGEFNQSPDPRRRGMIPATMRRNLAATSRFFQDRSEIHSMDYIELCQAAKAQDVIYMDPPYQGVCRERDKRYSSPLAYTNFVDALREMNERGLSFIVSYDGRTGNKQHGEPLPKDMNLTLVELEAGRSSQATLLGRDETTVESLYLSAPLMRRLKSKSNLRYPSNFLV